MRHDIVLYTFATVNTNKRKADFEVNFDDEKTRRTEAEQSIAKKDSI